MKSFPCTFTINFFLGLDPLAFPYPYYKNRICN